MLNGTFARRTIDLEKTAKMNRLPFLLSVNTNTDTDLYNGNDWAHDQLSAL